MNHGAAMRHGKARLCRAECPPHFLFVLPKRKRAGHGTKEKTLRDDLTPPCQITQNGGWPSRTSDKIQKSPTGCAIPVPFRELRPRICGHGTHRAANRTPPASLSAAAPPSNSGRGFQRGGTAVPPLCAQRGYGGRRRPPCFWWGSKGEVSLRQRYLLLTLNGNVPRGNEENI